MYCRPSTTNSPKIVCSNAETIASCIENIFIKLLKYRDKLEAKEKSKSMNVFVDGCKMVIRTINKTDTAINIHPLRDITG